MLNNILLNPQFRISLNSHQRSSYSKWELTQGTRDFGMFSPKWDVLYDTPLLKVQRSIWKKGQKALKSQRQQVTSRKQHFSDTAGQMNSHMNSQTLRQCVQDLYKFQADKIPPQRKGGGHRVLPRTKKRYMQLIAAKEGKSVSAVEQQWIYQSHSRTRPIPRSSQPTQTELHGLCCLFFKERKKKNKVG